VPELGPLPPPAGPPPGTDFPAPAAPGRPPPPLPREAVWGPPPPDPWGPLEDLALANGLARLADRCTRLCADPARGWSTVTVVHASAPSRTIPGPHLALPDEGPLMLKAARIPAGSLPDAPPGTDLLSRLRMVHRGMLPARSRPVDASWQQLGGRPAVLDRMSDGDGGRMSAFSLAAVHGPDDGLVVVGWAPAGRAETLERVGLPLATLARPDGAGLSWAQLPSWTFREQLRISGSSVQATVDLEPLLPGTDLRGWTDVVLARAPFLHDRRPVGDRAVTLRGVDLAWWRCFDWQPAGQGRLLTTVVTGIAGADGFSLVVDVPFEERELFADPDTVLAMVEVRPPRPYRPFAAPAGLPLPPWPAVVPAPAAPPSPVVLGPPTLPSVPPPPREPEPPAVATVAYVLPPVPPARPRPAEPRRLLRGPRDRYLDAAIDRVMIAAIDIADADPHGPTVPPQLLPGRPTSAADLDVAAVRAVLDAILMRGWGPPLPWHGRMDVEALAMARVGRWARIANLLVAATHPLPGRALDDEVWVTARLVATAAAEARTDRVDERSGLAGVLDRVRRGLEDPDGAWDDSVATVLVARPARYRLTTGFDGGSGHLLWADNDAARDRWDHPVDHFDLPVPLALARHVQSLIERYDLDHPDVGAETRRFSPAEVAEFRDDYLMTVDELRRALGPAYVVEERARLGPPS
jgi:hypothetical protein